MRTEKCFIGGTVTSNRDITIDPEHEASDANLIVSAALGILSIAIVVAAILDWKL